MIYIEMGEDGEWDDWHQFPVRVYSGPDGLNFDQLRQEFRDSSPEAEAAARVSDRGPRSRLKKERTAALAAVLLKSGISPNDPTEFENLFGEWLAAVHGIETLEFETC